MIFRLKRGLLSKGKLVFELRGMEARLPVSCSLPEEQGLSRASPERQERMKVRYAILIEQSEHNYAASVPDVPGCVATGATLEEVQQTLQEALQAHIEVMRDDEPLAPPTTQVAYVEIDVSRKGSYLHSLEASR